MRPLYELDTEVDNEFVLEAEYRKTLHDSQAVEKNEWETEIQDEFEDFVKDLAKATQLNYYYGAKLGWNQYYDQINEVLLPFSGMKNVSLGPEAFAQAVAEWQKVRVSQTPTVTEFSVHNHGESWNHYLKKAHMFPTQRYRCLVEEVRHLQSQIFLGLTNGTQNKLLTR